MQTRVIELDPLENNRQPVQEAVELLNRGELVALPTETVYGLAGDAFNPEAVAKIFEAKERPSFDPLIVHIHHAKLLDTVAEVPEALAGVVSTLARQFWPGPLTLILPRKPEVPDIVTSGLPTVAVRVPAHPVIRAVIKALGRPLAAPSANRFGHISPTSASAVVAELGGRIPLVLNGGACAEGLESTIIRPELDDRGKPRLIVLRAGPVTREQLKKMAVVRRPEPAAPESEARPDAPGQLASHYAPAKPFLLLEDTSSFTPKPGCRYALLSFEGDGGELENLHSWEKIVALSPGSGRLAEAAVRLFALMRQLDEDDTVDAIVAEPVSETGIGCAIMDRMRRASAKRPE